MIRNRRVRNWQSVKIFHSRGWVITDQYQLYI